MSQEYKPQFSIYHDLMKRRVRNILLVSTPYDGFVLEEDGRLSEQIFNEYRDLNLPYVPKIHKISLALDALEALDKENFDLVITMPRIEDMDPIEFGRRVKEKHPDKPVMMLTYEAVDEETLAKVRGSKYIDRIFYWSGSSKMLLALIKYVEDLANIEDDCRLGVQVILVVEDSPIYYSRFLPIIYTEIMKQTNYLVAHAVNGTHRLLRARARPKILLAETYEEAIATINKYRKNLLGIISDVGFPIQGKINSTLGLQLAGMIKHDIPGLPFLLQSEETSNAEKAAEIETTFLDKHSQNLLLELRAYISESYGFGPFIFKYPDGRVISTAADMSDFEKEIRVLPDESLMYHATSNHFFRWFRARTEFEVAEGLAHINMNTFETATELREFFLDFLDKFYKRYQKGTILEFGLSKLNIESSFTKIGRGSLGGKGRGIAFFSSLISNAHIEEKYPDVRIKVPCTFAICSDIFEEFVEVNGLQKMAVETENEEEIAAKFLEAEFSQKVNADLLILAQNVNYPIAVRSSSILEDSHTLPFAGMYKTYILPNNHEDFDVRFKQLTDAIKLVYASVFFQSPKKYAQNADVRIEEEKMSVLIQQLVGEQHGYMFYPVISGVAQSYNFYPFSHMKPHDGIVSLALGFGKTIVEGGHVFRFSPAYPKMNPPYSSTNELLQQSQRNFYALDLYNAPQQITMDEGCTYKKYNLEQAEQNGVLKFVASTYSEEYDLVYDSLSITGPRVITFASVLKHNLFPLPSIINDLFSIAKKAYGTDVEMEFAVSIPTDKSKKIEFYMLQVRPMVVGKEANEVKVETSADDEVICRSHHAIGNGIYQDVRDIIFIDFNKFSRESTHKIASEIGELNKLLYDEKRKCILIGFGRIGTCDPWLGIPIAWSQMSQAKVVIEVDRDDLQIEPSLGSHFYHNLISLKMGYFHLNKDTTKEEFVNWNWLEHEPAFRQTEYVKLIRSEHPFTIKIDGRSSTGIILKRHLL